MTECTTFVYTVFVKNITFSAEDDLIQQARLVARGQSTTLNLAFRQWLADYTASSGDAQGYDALMRRLQRVRADQSFSRDEMNER